MQSARETSAATRALLDEMRADAAPKEDSLAIARAKLAELRDYEMLAEEQEARLGETNAAIKEIKWHTLVDLMDEHSIRRSK